MTEIGETLRERRIRDKIDVHEVEQTTKIRAKYLRALENEEFDLLPGNSYAKSFLRTYADYLGLDGRELVNTYKRRYEEQDETELPIYASRPEPGLERPRRRIPNGLKFGGAGLALLIAALVLVGVLSSGDPEKDREPSVQAKPSAGAPAVTGKPDVAEADSAAPLIPLEIVSRGTTWICLADAGGRELIAGKVLLKGNRTKTFKSRSFSLRINGGGAQLGYGDKRKFVVDKSGESQAFSVSSQGVVPLALEKAPACA